MREREREIEKERKKEKGREKERNSITFSKPNLLNRPYLIESRLIQ